MSIEQFGPKIETEKTPAPKVLRGSPEFLEAREGAGKEDKGPLYLMMNLETKCSYKCPKCALPGNDRKDMGEPISLEQRKKVLAKAREIGVKELVIVGAGEPTENFDDKIKSVIESAHQEGLGTIMFTVASRLNREQAEFYRDHDVSLFVSLDAMESETYRELTGGVGDLEQVLKNIQMLREVYGKSTETVNGKKVVRLGINVTAQKPNKGQLDAIKKFAGDDMQFIVNPPIKRGKFKSHVIWERLVGDEYPELQRLAKEKSETGGHSSIDDGACSYFNRGVSVDVDGELLSCGYASETAHSLGSVTDPATLDNLAQHYQDMRTGYVQFANDVGEKPTCPLRDKNYQHFLVQLRKSKPNKSE